MCSWSQVGYRLNMAGRRRNVIFLCIVSLLLYSCRGGMISSNGIMTDYKTVWIRYPMTTHSEPYNGKKLIFSVLLVLSVRVVRAQTLHSQWLSSNRETIFVGLNFSGQV